MSWLGEDVWVLPRTARVLTARLPLILHRPWIEMLSGVEEQPGPPLCSLWRQDGPCTAWGVGGQRARCLRAACRDFFRKVALGSRATARSRLCCCEMLAWYLVITVSISLA